jgi:hypothetical protein
MAQILDLNQKVKRFTDTRELNETGATQQADRKEENGGEKGKDAVNGDPREAKRQSE